MNFLVAALVLCSFSNVYSSLSVQDFIDATLSQMKNKEEIIEKNPALVDRFYRLFQQKYPRAVTSRLIDLDRLQRIEIFKSNLKYVIRHNEDPSSTFKLKINEFSDWTDDERDTLRSKIHIDPFQDEQPVHSRDNIAVPSEYDWTNQTRVPGAVTPVKNQRHCGSCYAFGMVGALEKTYAEIYNKSGPLSPQQLIDCSGEGRCEGGSFIGSFSYIQQNQDKLNLESDYPSTPDGKDNPKCQKEGGVSLSAGSRLGLQYKRIPTGDEEYMKKIVYQNGPVYISFNCGVRTGNDTILREVSNKFDHYASGIFDVPGCPAFRNLNHAPVVVGYGTENGTDYWKVKNSWGPDWGESGYIKVRRNKNMCGIATATYSVGLF